jgi:hypothetical protein
MRTIFQYGGLGETRTLDQCLKRALLYRLSYQPAKDSHPNSCAPSRKIFRGGSPVVFPFAPRGNVFSSARDAR